MALSSKSLRELETLSQDETDEFDFGDPEIVTVEIAPGKFLSLQEPTASDLIEIDKIGKDKNLDDIDQTLKIICILHSPEPGRRKLTMKDARRLRSKQINMLGDHISDLLGVKREEPDMKSNDDTES